jgi:hypothetical protein
MLEVVFNYETEAFERHAFFRVAHVAPCLIKIQAADFSKINIGDIELGFKQCRKNTLAASRSSSDDNELAHG